MGMRQILFVLAVLGALLAGWVPAMAATADVARPAAESVHAMHHAGHDEGEKEHGKAAAHPTACTACFAIAAGTIEAGTPGAKAPARLVPLSRHLTGLAPLPLDPPPRF